MFFLLKVETFLTFWAFKCTFWRLNDRIFFYGGGTLARDDRYRMCELLERSEICYFLLTSDTSDMLEMLVSNPLKLNVPHLCDMFTLWCTYGSFCNPAQCFLFSCRRKVVS